MSDRLVYSTEKGACPDLSFDKKIPIVFHKRANAPERGNVFTAKAICKKGKKDLVIEEIENYTGYIRKNFEKSELKVEGGGCYRFVIVGGPYTRNNHNFYYAIPLRKLRNSESRNLNKLDAQTYILIQRLGEFLLGIRFNRDRTVSKLKKNQRNWDWFYNNFIN